MRMKESLRRDVMKQVGSITCRFNAPYAKGYGFCANLYGTEIVYGEFLNGSELEDKKELAERFDYVYYFDKKEIRKISK